jgi:glyoxalase family protein
MRAGSRRSRPRSPTSLSELVSHPEGDPRPPWEDGPVPAEHAIRGLHSVALTEAGYEHTAELLTGALGFRLASESASRCGHALCGDRGSGYLACPSRRIRAAAAPGSSRISRVCSSSR